jgi:hypothetical protein
MASDLREVVLAHEGLSLSGITVTRGPQTNVNGHSFQTITITNDTTEAILATPEEPIRIVLMGDLWPNNIKAHNAAGTSPDGKQRQGAFWLVTETIPPSGSSSLNLVFKNPSGMPLQYELLVQDHAGYSEAAASARAFQALSPQKQEQILDFLRAQLIDGRLGEGSGGIPPADGTGG